MPFLEIDFGSLVLEMYRAMKDANKEVEMMIYPRAGHSITRPIQRKTVLTNWLNWANKHIDRK